MPKLKTYTLFYIIGAVLFLLPSCSNKKNTAFTRTYHAINTKYNIHFNADEAYKESLKKKNEETKDNLSDMLYIFPNNSDTAKQKATGTFTTTIDKTTKAIKLHSISAKPRRDASKKKDLEYQAWLKQKEFNPYLENTWMLLGKAELEDRDYIQAISTFLYITKIYSSNPYIVRECQLWIARAYTEMGWMYEAADMLHKIDTSNDPLPTGLEGLYATVKSNYLIHKKEYTQAIPLLEQAIKNEKNGRLKLRMRYLLGQIYADQGNNAKALEIFSSIPGLSTPPNYTFNANLQSLLLSATTDRAKSVKKLEKMAKESKNEEYVDLIYYTIGNIYLNAKDSVNAIENYKKAIKLSKNSGYDKALAQIKLADIYYNQHNFIAAQPEYSGALQQITKENDAYERVAHRSPALDELVVYAKTVYEQDSLQHLANMPEDERLAVINEKIAYIKAEEERKKKEEEYEQLMAEREDRIDTWGGDNNKIETGFAININSNTASSGSKFYFYNPQLVEQGKVNFKKTWGNRKPEDDWRRRDKKASSNSSFFDDQENTDGDPAETAEDNETDTSSPEGEENPTEDTSSENDIYSPEYYIQQLPLTPEAIKESNELIENALYNMGLIYKYKLEDLDLSIDAFTTNVDRFPGGPNLEKIYYELLLIYMQRGESNMMDSYRNMILAEFPEGPYTVPLSQPDYEWNFRHIALLQDSLYNETYNAYLAGDINTVRQNSYSLETKYPFGDLMPKFMLLDALTYAQTRDVESLEKNLQKIVDNYPKDEEVTPLASSILERIANGQVLMSDGSPIRGLDWSEAFKVKEELAQIDSTLKYTDSINTEYMILLVYQEKTIDRNELLYNVADYNFSNYVVQTFDISFDYQSPLEILQIKTFNSFTSAKSYINRMFEKDGLVEHLDPSILIIPISVENYGKLLLRKNIDNYLSFYEKTLGRQTPDLIKYWKKDKSKLKKGVETDEPEIKTGNQGENIIPNEEIKINPVDTTIINTTPKIDSDKGKNDTQKEDDIINNIQKTGKNPVDGIKGFFDKYNNKSKLTKEEREALKKEQELEKKRLEELKAKQKIELDSIQAHGKAVQDSLRRVADEELERKRQALEEKNRKAQEALKQKEEVQKEALKQKEDRRKELEQKRKEKEKAQKEKLRLQQEERKRKLKEQEERKRQKEKERKEKERNREQERKERAKNSG